MHARLTSPISQGTARMGLALLVTLAGWGALASAQEARKPFVLADFEEGSLSKSWNGQGPIRLARLPLPEAAKGDEPLPGGHGVMVEARPRSVLFTLDGQTPRDWRRFESLEFWVYRPTEEARRMATSIMDVQLAEQGPHAAFSRRVDLSHQGWSKFSLRLGWFRTMGGRVPRWDRVERLQFHFRDDANVWLDAITLREGTSEFASETTADELRALAFPGVSKSPVRLLEREHVRILTNTPELELEKLGDHLAKVAAAVYRDMPFLEKLALPPWLIVFRAKEEYQGFTPRFAQKLSAVAAPPQAGGYTLQGVATSSWDPVQGSLRPVYTHEYVHALLERAAALANKSEWFQEGLANRYQLEFHPQPNWREIVASGLRGEDQRLPLRVLCNGQTIPLNRYWQAVTVIEMLQSSPAYQQRFPELVAAFQKAGSTDLGSHLATVLQSDWGALESAWRRYCEATYANSR